MFNTLKDQRFLMSERLVEIPIRKEVRNMIKDAKGVKTYSEFLGELVCQLNSSTLRKNGDIIC